MNAPDTEEAGRYAIEFNEHRLDWGKTRRGFLGLP